jgi:hypothetical protein
MSSSRNSLQCGVASARSFVSPGGILAGSVRSLGCVVSTPNLVTKGDADTLAAGELVNGFVLADNLSVALTLSIPNVEPILAAFAAANIDLKAGDQFEVTFARGLLPAQAPGNLVLEVAVAAGGNTACTWATGVAPSELVAAAGSCLHVAKLTFEVTSTAVPAIRIHSIVG